MKDYELISLDYVGTDDRVARITLNRPDKMNALSQELMYEFDDALPILEARDDIHVIIVKGEGRAFSAGYDLAAPRGSDAIARQFTREDLQGRRLAMNIRSGMQQITDIHMYFWNMAKVTIAQVHGYALAVGHRHAEGEGALLHGRERHR
jgi:enoyl-CoA hydratase